MSSSTPIILDVDTGIDDAFALALAVNAPGIELVAVTTLAGNVEVERATRNTLDVLHALGADHIPVHRGASRPLCGEPRDAMYFHGHNGLGNATLARSPRDVAADKGPAAIIRLARERPGELTLVCVGPLTNLAIALNVEPDLGTRLKRVVSMGGAFHGPGNTTPYAEFNVLADPHAAARVFEAKLPGFIAVSLDVTRQVTFSRADWIAAGSLDQPAASLLYEVGRSTFNGEQSPPMPLHDPLAVAIAVEPRLVTTESLGVRVTFDGERRGQTRTDPSSDAVIDVSVAVDQGRFLDWFFTTLALPRADAPAIIQRL